MKTFVLDDLQDNQFSLFNGEVLLRPNCISVKLHNYENSDENITVLLIGTIHIGTPSYVQQLRARFAKCDAVFFERIGGDDEHLWTVKDIRNVARTNLTTGMHMAMSLFYEKFAGMQDIFRTKNKILTNNIEEKEWIPADVGFTSEQAKQTTEGIKNAFDTIEDKIKVGVIEDHISKILRIEQGKFQFHEFSELLISAYLDSGISEILMNLSPIKLNNEYYRNEFRYHLRKRPTITHVGIFFGVAHLPSIRSVLENCGFIHKSSTEIIAIPHRQR